MFIVCCLFLDHEKLLQHLDSLWTTKKSKSIKVWCHPTIHSLKGYFLCILFSSSPKVPTVLREIFVNSVARQLLNIQLSAPIPVGRKGTGWFVYSCSVHTKSPSRPNRQMNPDSLLQVHFSPILSSFPLWLSEHEFKQGLLGTLVRSVTHLIIVVWVATLSWMKIEELYVDL